MTKFGIGLSLVVLIVLGGIGYLVFKSSIIENPSPNPTPVVSGGCFVGGCSGQICSDQEGIVSTCEYREEYACYKTAKCERQASGQCGWTQTTALSACLSNSQDKTLGKIAGGYLEGHVTIGPFCPVEREDEPCEVPPEVYTSREAVVYGSNGATIKDRVHLDTQGNYKITLAPGNYFIQIVPAGIGPGEKKYITIKSFETSIINFDIDTGIR